MDDTNIFLFCLFTLIGINLLIPIMSSVFGASSASTDFNPVLETDSIDSESSFFTIIKVLSGIIGWSFFGTPAWLNMAMLIFLRIPAYVILAKWVRGI